MIRAASAKPRRAFLRPALRRGNVALYTESLAQKIIVESGRAVGVVYERAGQRHEVRTTREVILSAGALQSPQLLLLSGIGPPAELQAVGITPVHELRGVGRNFHDHLACPVLMRSADSTSYGISARALPRGVLNVLQYLCCAPPLASNVFESRRFLRPGQPRSPDVQFVFQPAARPRPSFPLPIGHGYAVSPVSLYPKSRGRVSLSGPDAHAAPLIDPALLAVEEDIQPLVRAIRLSRRILAAPYFARYKATETPGEGAERGRDRQFHPLHGLYRSHQVGTCRMGSGADAVVDPQLRAPGLRAGRPVIPSIVGGNTNAVVVMIAERPT